MDRKDTSQKGRTSKVLTNGFDLNGNTILRQLAHWLRSKLAIMGNVDTGPGLRNLGIMILLHYLGKPLFMLRSWWQSRFALRARLRHLLGR